MPAPRPNILLINCDDLGYGDLGCYGSARNDTPHLDRLAAGGVRFTDFYMASPVCSASRAAMLTGCFPNRVGFHRCPVLFPGAKQGLHPEERTLARRLRDAGYATKIVGKWHCGDQPEFLPTAHGFDEYFGLPYSNDMGRQANRPDSPPLPLLRDDRVIQQQPDQRGLTEAYTREGVDFIDRHRDRPFFLYLAHMYVHVPLFVPKPFLERSRNGAYGGAVACIDWSTGVLLERLRAHGLLENTLVIFTSDNGSRARDEGGSNAPLRGTKATTWEGGQRVPCLMHWPARLRAGQTVSSVYRSIDLLPTLCALAGADGNGAPNRPLDGVDFSRLLLEGIEEHPDNEMIYYAGTGLNALRQGHWKLHVSYRRAWEEAKEPEEPALYDLRADPGEERNVIDRHPEVVARMQVRLAEIRQQFGDRYHGIEGAACRPTGWREDARPLTAYDPEHPYIIAQYDLPDMPTLSG